MSHQIKTIDLHVKQWRDRTYGTTYFAARIVLNYGMSDASVICVPFQYGYGSHAEFVACRTLCDARPELGDRSNALWRMCKDNGIILRVSYSYDKKRDCELFGAAID